MTNPVKSRIEKLRLDKLLVDQGHAASRERAQALILAGRVLVGEQRIDKPGTSVPAESVIRLLGSDLKYVSRGGLKLERALEHWSIDLTGLSCVDIGASTGGFTDCMLQSGASSVLAVDTGYWPLHRYNPGNEKPLRLDSKRKRPVSDFLAEENRFASLQRSRPETAADAYTLTAPFSFGFGLTDWLEASIKPSVLYARNQDWHRRNR